jgi:hypothetical protein
VRQGRLASMGGSECSMRSVNFASPPAAPSFGGGPDPGRPP